MGELAAQWGMVGCQGLRLGPVPVNLNTVGPALLWLITALCSEPR